MVQHEGRVVASSAEFRPLGRTAESAAERKVLVAAAHLPYRTAGSIRHVF